MAKQTKKAETDVAELIARMARVSYVGKLDRYYQFEEEQGVPGEVKKDMHGFTNVWLSKPAKDLTPDQIQAEISEHLGKVLADRDRRGYANNWLGKTIVVHTSAGVFAFKHEVPPVPLTRVTF